MPAADGGEPNDIVVHRIITADGVHLALHQLGNPTDVPVPVPVLLVPGTFSNHTFWFGTRGVGFARDLAAAGFLTYVLDPRGHGESQRPASNDEWDFDDWAREDVPAALRTIIADGRKTFVVGHSAGGAAVLAALAAHPELHAHILGLVTVATPLPWLQPWRGVGARLIRMLSGVFKGFPARLLRLGPEDELRGVMTQWMTWNIEGHWRGDDGTDYEAGLRKLRLPLLSVAGAGDHFFSPPPACRGLHDLIGSRDKEFLLCGRGEGFSEDFDHVTIVIGRSARTEVWPRVTDWLVRRAGRGRMG